MAATLTSSAEKVATPAIAALVTCPPSTPVPGGGIVASDIATLLAKLVTVFPNASCAATLTAGKMFAPTDTVDGCTVNASTEAAPGVMLNVVDCADVTTPSPPC